MSTRNLPAPKLRDARPRANTLYRTAAAVLRAHVQNSSPEETAKALFGRKHGLDVVLRASSTPATLTNPSWAGAALQNVIRGDLIQQITAQSAAAALMETGVRVDLSGVASITIPGCLYDPAAGGAWVPEGMPIPMRARY